MNNTDSIMQELVEIMKKDPAMADTMNVVLTALAKGYELGKAAAQKDA